MTFIVANPLSDFEILQAFEKKYDSRILGVSFSVEKNEYEYHGENKSIMIWCQEDNTSWKGWLSGWKNCISNLKIELPSEQIAAYPKAYLLALKECAKAISDAGVKTSPDTGYHYLYKSVDQFMDFIKSEFEKEFPLPEYAKYVPQWNSYKAINRENYEKYKYEVSDYCDIWNSWKQGWKKAISRFNVELPSQFEISSESTSFEIIEKTKKALLEAGFKAV